MSFIQFLGTAGARYATIKQTCASGGVWLRWQNTNILIDPGPGSLVKIREEKDLDPDNLDAILLTHKHLDHSNDINIMTEVMTAGGRKKRGLLCVPSDALGVDGVVHTYVREFPQDIFMWEKNKTYVIGELQAIVTEKLEHTVDTYGMIFICGDTRIALIPDTEYFEALSSYFVDIDILIINVVMPFPEKTIKHLCLDDATEIITQVMPRKVVLTHFGVKIIEYGLGRIERELSEKTGVHIICAIDGQRICF